MPHRRWVLMTICTTHSASGVPMVRELSRHFTKRAVERAYRRWEAMSVAELWVPMIVTTAEMPEFHQWVSTVFTQSTAQGGTE